jgi:hypothetical protein
MCAGTRLSSHPAGPVVGDGSDDQFSGTTRETGGGGRRRSAKGGGATIAGEGRAREDENVHLPAAAAAS